ncbi:MAG: hypothetical protein ACOH5I_08315 [Oligoflexus sp.]
MRRCVPDKMKHFVALGLIVFGALACSTLAQWTAPKKEAVTTTPPAFAAVEKDFWQAFHYNKFEDIPQLLQRFKAIYVEYPGHGLTAARIGFLHTWRLAERRRMDPIPAEVISDATLCQKFFQEGSQLNPKDARFKGFWASCILAEADIHQDEKNLRKGYFMMKDAIHDWPEFNYFTAGYVLSNQDWDSDLFQEAIDWQWSNLDACSGEEISRTAPDYSPYMKNVVKEGQKRACWNSAIVPHNFEGFFLNMGDMLVKKGDVEVAKKIYATAKLSPDYKTWPYRQLLEDRISNAEKNVAAFRKKLANNEQAKPTIMFNSEFACMACHRKE